MPELLLRNLSFAYRRRSQRAATAALRDVSFNLPSGVCAALIGPNGSGKSTLSKILNGILKPDSGQILLDGLEIAPHQRPGSFVAYGFQNPDDQFFARSVRDEIEFGPRNLGLSRSEVERNVSEAAELLGLTDSMKEHPLDIPFVLRKRVSVASALAMGRPWTVLDEPTLGQDYSFQRRLAKTFEHLQTAGRGLIVITHEPEFAMEACSQLLVLSRGYVEFNGSLQEWVRPESEFVFGFKNLVASAARRYPALVGTATLVELKERMNGTVKDANRDVR